MIFIRECLKVLKGIVSILSLKKLMKKKCSKNYSDHLRINKNEVYTAATLSILYKLGAMIFENI